MEIRARVMGARLDSGAPFSTNGVRVTSARRGVMRARLLWHMWRDPSYAALWGESLAKAVSGITASVAQAVAKSETSTELNVRAPVPDGWNPVEVGQVFVWMAQAAARDRLCRMDERGELARPEPQA